MSSFADQVIPAIRSDYDRQSALKAFDDSKSGVKGLVDAGLSKIPPFFIHKNNQQIINDTTTQTHLDIPVIDLNETNSRRREIIQKIRDACENWGFFQIVDHGIPERVLDEMIDGVRGFHEMETEEKIKYYSRDHRNKFSYTSNFHLFTGSAALWSDMFFSVMAPNPPPLEDLPPICRDILIEYSNHIMKLGSTLLKLLSEALRLNPNHLENLGCGEGLFVMGHYYPACPEPELTVGSHTHTDSAFFTILLQDLLGGLQVLHKNRWVDVSPISGALVVNVADLLQLISNDTCKSVKHRVLAQKAGPRISMVAFFRPFTEGTESKMFRPIKELVSEENPCVYREVSLREYMTLRCTDDTYQTSALDPFKVDP